MMTAGRAEEVCIPYLMGAVFGSLGVESCGWSILLREQCKLGLGANTHILPFNDVNHIQVCTTSSSSFILIFIEAPSAQLVEKQL